jgi:hypothetical protein
VLALVLDLADAFGEGDKGANWRQQRRYPFTGRDRVFPM